MWATEHESPFYCTLLYCKLFFSHNKKLSLTAAQQGPANYIC